MPRISPNFILDRKSILKHPRLMWLSEEYLPLKDHLDNIEKYIIECYANSHGVTQAGRVIALRATDRTRMSSAFKSAIYLGKYNDMANKERFLNSMVSAGHSYEPIRNESITFLFIGVSKNVYDHLVTYSVGRYGRIAGGQRANIPWGFEIPVEAKDPTLYTEGLQRVQEVAVLAKQKHEEQMQAARSLLPTGYIMPPFIFEFSEEALIKSLFRQRLFERGAQGATVEVVKDMLDACLKIDKEKWERLIEYHGEHTKTWERIMRTLRSQHTTFEQLIDKYRLVDKEYDEVYEEPNWSTMPLYEIIIATLGKQKPSMWEK